MPGAARRSSRASSGDSGERVWTFTASEWPLTTGTRTHVALTRIVGSPRILRVSLIELELLVGVVVARAKLPAWGSALNAIRCA